MEFSPHCFQDAVSSGEWAPAADAVAAFEERLRAVPQLQRQIEVIQSAAPELSSAIVATLCIRVALYTRRAQIGAPSACNGVSGAASSAVRQQDRLGHQASREARSLRSAALSTLKRLWKAEAAAASSGVEGSVSVSDAVLYELRRFASGLEAIVESGIDLISLSRIEQCAAETRVLLECDVVVAVLRAADAKLVHPVGNFAAHAAQRCALPVPPLAWAQRSLLHSVLNIALILLRSSLLTAPTAGGILAATAERILQGGTPAAAGAPRAEEHQRDTQVIAAQFLATRARFALSASSAALAESAVPPALRSLVELLSSAAGGGLSLSARVCVGSALLTVVPPATIGTVRVAASMSLLEIIFRAISDACSSTASDARIVGLTAMCDYLRVSKATKHAAVPKMEVMQIAVANWEHPNPQLAQRGRKVFQHLFHAMPSSERPALLAWLLSDLSAANCSGRFCTLNLLLHERTRGVHEVTASAVLRIRPQLPRALLAALPRQGGAAAARLLVALLSGLYTETVGSVVAAEGGEGQTKKKKKKKKKKKMEKTSGTTALEGGDAESKRGESIRAAVAESPAVTSALTAWLDVWVQDLAAALVGGEQREARVMRNAVATQFLPALPKLCDGGAADRHIAIMMERLLHELSRGGEASPSSSFEERSEVYITWTAAVLSALEACRNSGAAVVGIMLARQSSRGVGEGGDCALATTLAVEGSTLLDCVLRLSLRAPRALLSSGTTVTAGDVVATALQNTSEELRIGALGTVLSMKSVSATPGTSELALVATFVESGVAIAERGQRMQGLALLRKLQKRMAASMTAHVAAMARRLPRDDAAVDSIADDAAVAERNWLDAPSRAVQRSALRAALTRAQAASTLPALAGGRAAEAEAETEALVAVHFEPTAASGQWAQCQFVHWLCHHLVLLIHAGASFDSLDFSLRALKDMLSAFAMVRADDPPVAVSLLEMLTIAEMCSSASSDVDAAAESAARWWTSLRLALLSQLSSTWDVFREVAADLIKRCHPDGVDALLSSAGVELSAYPRLRHGSIAGHILSLYGCAAEAPRSPAHDLIGLWVQRQAALLGALAQSQSTANATCVTHAALTAIRLRISASGRSQARRGNVGETPSAAWSATLLETVVARCSIEIAVGLWSLSLGTCSETDSSAARFDGAWLRVAAFAKRVRDVAGTSMAAASCNDVIEAAIDLLTATELAYGNANAHVQALDDNGAALDEVDSDAGSESDGDVSEGEAAHGAITGDGADDGAPRTMYAAWHSSVATPVIREGRNILSVNASWLRVREACTLIGDVATAVCVASRCPASTAGNEPMFRRVAKSLRWGGEIMLSLLTRSKHSGVLREAATTLKKLAAASTCVPGGGFNTAPQRVASLSEGTIGGGSALPPPLVKLWIDRVLGMLDSEQCTVQRRAGGLPHAVVCLLSLVPQEQRRVRLEEVMQRVVALVHRGFASNEVAAVDETLWQAS